MEDHTELTLRKICCTCLSVDRKLHQLCKLENGLNNLFFLLSPDSEAYQAMFSRDATLLFVCWECTAFMRRQRKFMHQVCVAQKKLSQIIDGSLDLKSTKSLSNLTCCYQNSYNKQLIYNNNTTDNFVDCGPNINNIKCESDSNIPLSDIQNESANESAEDYCTELLDEITVSESKIEIKPLSLKSRKLKKENIIKRGSLKRKVKAERDESVKEEGYSKIHMTEDEMVESIKRRKLEKCYINATNKCESCVEVFKDESELVEHNSRLHIQKPKLVQCNICLVYIKFWWLPEHKNEHYLRYQCHLCEQVCYSLIDMLTHLREVHAMKHALAPGVMKKLKRKAVLINPVLAPKRQNIDDTPPNGESPLGFKCKDCNKYFENRYLRYKHILKLHREGHKCNTCGKTFAFKNTLNKHEQIHGAPQPKQQCPICGKMVRADRARFHARIHGDRKSYDCVACDKRFVSHDSYEKHLKYSRTHAVRDVHKYKCTLCDKGFRTTRELDDHVNYNHMGKTQHKCPICDKALATRRCVTRHVSRAHHGIKEKSGDKILCQTCGKAFRDKKCLREHELIHTGEKPLSCDMCGRTFRQSACLYTHRRRVHKVAPKRLHIQHAAGDDTADNKSEIN